MQLERGKASRCRPEPFALHGFQGNRSCHSQDVFFRDPSSFVAGELSCHQSYWKFILSEHPKKDEILSYIVCGVNISDFFVPFKGDFQGKFYNCATPPAAFFPNSKSCLDFEEFISSTILDRVKNGSLLVWGKVGSVQPPHLVLPITVEPTKPRLVLLL